MIQVKLVHINDVDRVTVQTCWLDLVGVKVGWGVKLKKDPRWWRIEAIVGPTPVDIEELRTDWKVGGLS